MILDGKIFQTLAEVKDNILSSIKVVQLAMAHMFQDKLFNKVQKVSTMHHAMH